VPSYYLVRVDPSAASTEAMPERLRKLDAGASGAHRVSSEEGLKLLAAAAIEASESQGDDAFQVAVNFVMEPAGIWEGASKEHPTGPDGYTSDAYAWSYLKHYHVLEAWDALAAAGKLGNRVKMMVLDGGFVPSADFPANAKILPANSWKV